MADTTIGDSGGQRLKRYWLTEGLRKWAFSPHPWTALYRELARHVSPGLARRLATVLFHEHFGYWPGSRGGKNPVGPG